MTAVSTTSARIPAVYLVALDGGPGDDHVLELACGLGAALGGAAELHIVHVLVPAPPTDVVPNLIVTTTDLVDTGRAVLDRATGAAASRFSGRIAGHLASGDPWREVVRMAATLSADLVIVGTAGRTGIAHLVLGSVAEKVVRHAGCPVLVVRPTKHEQPGDAPAIEPPSPQCLATQRATQGEKAELPPTYALGSMNFRPQAVRFWQLTSGPEPLRSR